MNQEKIGKFIAKCRKDKDMTQSELAERLGVTDKSIGNWENGRNMPDLSLFKPLCDELDITINELLSGEHIKKERYQEKFEENIINTIDYSTKRINISNTKLGIILIVMGIVLSLVALTSIPSDSSWGGFYSIVGGIISSIGVVKLFKRNRVIKKIFIWLGYFILYLLVLFVVDYISVVSLKQIPRFCTIKEYFGQGIVCNNPFYNVYWINIDTVNEYIIVDNKKEYTTDTVPIVPFNRTKSGFDNIIKYKNKYVGNNSNDGNLLRSLPLSEYGYTFKIDNYGLIINYHITDWYINDNLYLERSLLYNSVASFSLIENLEYIKYNFSGKTYEVKREDVVNNYPHYNELLSSRDNFNKYLEQKIVDDDFVNEYFNKII